MSSNENLEFFVSLDAKESETIEKAKSLIDQAQQIQPELKELLEKIKAELEKDTASPKDSKEGTPKQQERSKQKEDKEKSEALEFIESLDTKQLNNLQSLATNPMAFVQSQTLSFLTRLGPHSAAIIGIVTAAISSPFVLEKIIKVLAQPGGPFNRDWRRFIEKQIDAGLSRELQERKRTGRDLIAFQQGTQGYVPGNEVWSGTNQLYVNENRLSRIGLNSREEGLID